MASPTQWTWVWAWQRQVSTLDQCRSKRESWCCLGRQALVRELVPYAKTTPCRQKQPGAQPVVKEEPDSESEREDGSSSPRSAHSPLRPPGVPAAEPLVGGLGPLPVRGVGSGAPGPEALS